MMVLAGSRFVKDYGKAEEPGKLNFTPDPENDRMRLLLRWAILTAAFAAAEKLLRNMRVSGGIRSPGAWAPG